MNFSTSRK